MMHDTARWASVQQFLGREALLLDEKKWDEFLALYDRGAEYWVPAWDDSGRLTADPKTEISLIYYPDRSGLEDRVFRIRTGRSAASTPEIRTLHLFTLLSVEESGDGVRTRSNWMTQSFRDDQIITYRGWAEHRLVPQGNSWAIAGKRTIVLDPITDTVLDFYMI